MSAASFRVLLKMTVHPGMGEDFIQAWAEHSSVVEEHPANRGHSLATSTEDDDVFYIVSDWSSEREFREFEDSPAHLEHRARLHPYRSSGSIAFLELVAEAPATGAARSRA
ncbi:MULTISPECIES: antibiotic biosynthesis monooxygenase family protein [Streptomyces]|uniref:Antibiotic biosynthesis monooxygenase family protein n=1 Tax=Streptomyces huasconensis TaxID=1854574 RepID=A0ABV3M7I4_9ACTN|nr:MULTISPECIES: antibiotic biosynthesis monooxygenase family protein [Streptomyces]UFQ18589.1 antibiotic biosynthesis monooxygenase [Streptomyces huasconensis]WCL88204.1 antibiotic biosynthesis monooxygenase [Streptomyces sp. JCM 35825]